jgi:hypothetical protein
MSLIEQRHSPGEQLNGIVARPESDARDLAIASELRPNKARSITSALSQKKVVPDSPTRSSLFARSHQ